MSPPPKADEPAVIDRGLADTLAELEAIRELVRTQAPLASPLLHPRLENVRLYLLTLHQTWSDTMDDNEQLIAERYSPDLRPA